MSAPAQTAALETLVEAHTAELHLPTVRRRFRALATEAAREQQTPLAYLAAPLEAEVAQRAERRKRRRLLDARFPLLKRLEDFRFADNPSVPQATIRPCRGLLDRRPPDLGVPNRKPESRGWGSRARRPRATSSGVRL